MQQKGRARNSCNVFKLKIQNQIVKIFCENQMEEFDNIYVRKNSRKEKWKQGRMELKPRAELDVLQK